MSIYKITISLCANHPLVILKTFEKHISKETPPLEKDIELIYKDLKREHPALDGRMLILDDIQEVYNELPQI